jgi:Beta-propeller repeat/Abnormal spindle-like microcephaly-assoc'd, ASPM-SPD-2-Hydin
MAADAIAQRWGTEAMRIKALAVKLFVAMLGNVILLDPHALAQSQPDAVQRAQAVAGYGSLPLTFEANQGQTAAQVKFLSKGKGYTAFLTANGMLLSLRPSEGAARRPAMNGALMGTAAMTTASMTAAGTQAPATLEFTLVGAAANPTVHGEDMQPGKVNYFFGNDATKWRTNIATYARIRYHNVYPGIDMIYYGNHRQIEYDFAISPGADPNQIQFQIKGAKNTSLDAKGDLVLDTGDGVLHFQNPKIYQESDGSRIPVQGAYVMKDSTHVGFNLSALDPSKPTVIDPVLVYGTYLGGSGDDDATGIAVDSSGNVYIAGYTDSTDFPLATFGSLPAGDPHVFVAKLNASGSTLLYADYIGGNSYDLAFAMTLDSTGEVYLTGSTASSNFPVVNAYQPAYPGSLNGFVTKVSADGSMLVYSTYLGGNGSDIPTSIELDSSLDMLVAGSTSSNNFPVANAYQGTMGANQGGFYGTYGFLTKFTADGSALSYSTYFGGNDNAPSSCTMSNCPVSPSSGIAGLAVDSSGNAYVGGSTNTYNFPTTSGVYESATYAPQNNEAGFVAKFSSTGTLTYSTYFDETSGVSTTINAIAVDGSGSAYVTGLAFSDGTFPVTSTTICDPVVEGQNCEFTFITKFDPEAATLVYSTFLGPYNLASPTSIALDASNDAYVLGSTTSTSFQLVNGIEGFSTEGSQYQAGVDYDVIVAEIDPLASTELLATYLGGSGNNGAAAMALDASANIYVAGTTDSIDFPVTQGSFQGIIGGNTDSFIVKISPGVAAAVSATPASLDYSTQALGTSSTAQTVLLRNMGSAALSIASITASTGFTQTNTCGSSVPAAGTCTLTVTFAPSAAGSDSGSISMVDDAAGSPHVINMNGFATGAVVALSPATLTFTGLPVGTASAQQTVTLTNSGNESLSISGIEVSGDYSQTNNCGTSLAVSASCQIEITFTPTATGTRSGALTIADGAFNSPQTLTLTGTGDAALGITLSASTLTFAGQALDSTSSSQTVTVTNHATTSVKVSKVSVSGSFSQTNNCGTVAANGGTCAVTVKFAPSASGASAGTLTISASGGVSETASLSGTGVDFGVASSPSSDTVKDGSTASYKLTITPVGGSFTSAIQLSCSGEPTGTTCSFSPSSVTPGATAASVTMTIATTASTSQALPRRSTNTYVALATWMQLQGLGLFGIVFAGSKRRSKKATMLVLLALVIGAALLMTACAGGTGIAPQTSTGTATGSYTVSATGTSGSLKHSTSLTLTVQ